MTGTHGQSSISDCRCDNATLTGKQSDVGLKLSVISSSCEETMLSQLFTELWMLRTFAVDFYPRQIDIKAMGEQMVKIGAYKSARKGPSFFRDQLESGPASKALDWNIEDLAHYVNEQRKEAAEEIFQTFGIKIPHTAFRIPALATFFPDISSRTDKAENAGKALAEAVDLARLLGAGVVEFVLGRRVERCPYPPENRRDYKCDYVYSSASEDKIKRVVEIIEKHVFEKLTDKCGRTVRLAAEIEPGFSYVLNDRHAVTEYIHLIRKKGMQDCVGLNMDIGHLMILGNAPRQEARISVSDVSLWKEHIFHAHISDNVGHHFRDLVPGTIHPLYEEDRETEFEEWVRLCKEIAEENEHFSRHIALELEGCSRIQWVQRSLLRLGYLIRMINAKGS